MRCEDATRAISAGDASPDVEIHLSACDDCRLAARDWAGLRSAFARARAEWRPSPGFRVVVPSVDWRRLAVAACLLLLPLAAAAVASLRSSAEPAPAPSMAVLLDPAAPTVPSDRQLLASFFLEDAR